MCQLLIRACADHLCPGMIDVELSEYEVTYMSL
jgi:hypothetical protein